MRILLTGSEGALAMRVRDRLRETEEIVQLGGVCCPGVAVAEGALTDAAAVRAAMEGCEVVVCDLLGANEVQDAPALRAGVDHLLAAARATGVRRVVLLSTALPSPQGGLHQAEDHALLVGADRVVVLCSARLLAPDRVGGALGARIVALLRGDSVVATSGRICLADARDVAAAVVAALHRGRTGRRYHLGSRPFRVDRLDVAVLRQGALWRPLPWCLPELPLDDAEVPLGLADEALDLRAAKADLGWWTRRPGLTLRDVVGVLANGSGDHGAPTG